MRTLFLHGAMLLQFSLLSGCIANITFGNYSTLKQFSKYESIQRRDLISSSGSTLDEQEEGNSGEMEIQMRL